MIKVFSNIGTIIVSITAIATLLSIVIKTSYNFLIESVKSEFKNVPGENSLFNVVTRFIYKFSGIVQFILITCLILSIILNFINGDIDKISEASRRYSLFSYIITGITIAPTLLDFYIFGVVKRCYKEWLLNIHDEQIDNKIVKCNRFTYNSSLIIVGIMIIFITLLGNEELKLIIDYVFILIINLINVFISMGINDVSESINSNYKYSLITSNGVITTKMYL